MSIRSSAKFRELCPWCDLDLQDVIEGKKRHLENHRKPRAGKQSTLDGSKLDPWNVAKSLGLREA